MENAQARTACEEAYSLYFASFRRCCYHKCVSIFIPVIMKKSDELIRQPVDFPQRHLGGETAPLSPFQRSFDLRSDSLPPLLRLHPATKGAYPLGTPRPICCTNQSKYTYSSARSPLRETMPARLRMASSPDRLTSNEIVTEIMMLPINKGLGN
jgi:hypothetical protein